MAASPPGGPGPDIPLVPLAGLHPSDPQHTTSTSTFTSPSLSPSPSPSSPPSPSPSVSSVPTGGISSNAALVTESATPTVNESLLHTTSHRSGTYDALQDPQGPLIETASGAQRGSADHVDSTPSTVVGDAGSQAAPDPSQDDPRPAVEKDWVSSWLQLKALAPFFFFTLVLIAAITALTVVSQNNSGIAKINNASSDVDNYSVGLGLAWTTLPVLVFTAYAAVFTAILNACSQRQPYVELYQDDKSAKGAALEVSLLLDYRNYNILTKPWRAFRNRHLLLFIGFLLMPVVVFALISLAAHLFDAANVSQIIGATVIQNTQFNQHGFTPRSDIVLAFELVTSSRIYGANPLAWTTDEYSFQNFSSPHQETETIGTGNFSVATAAYAATMDCAVLEYNVDYGLSTDNTGSILIHGVDRGCKLLTDIAATGNGSRYFSTYLQTFGNPSCSSNLSDSRLALFAATYSDSVGFSNVTVVSCKPAYYSSQGTLEVTFDSNNPSSSPTIRNFAPLPNSKKASPQDFSEVFERNINQGAQYDNTASLSASGFGKVILEYAQKVSPEGYIQASVLEPAMETIFASIYAVTSRLYLIRPAAESEVQGQLSISTTRLRIVPPISYVMISILSVVAVYIVFMWLYVQTHRSILYEEPRAIFGSASLVLASGFEDEYARLRNATNDGRIVEAVIKELQDTGRREWWRQKWRRYIRGVKPSPDKRAGWMLQDWKSPRTSKISKKDASARPPSWLSAFQRNFGPQL